MKSVIIGISCYGYFLVTHFLPKWLLHTPHQESVARMLCPQPPPHQLQTPPVEHVSLLRFITIGISCYEYLLLSHFLPKMFPITPQQESCSNVVSPTTATSTPNTPYGASLIINIFWYRYLLISVSFAIGIFWYRYRLI